MHPTILTANNYYYLRGGSEWVYFEEKRLLEEAGWRVVPFSMRHPSNIASDWDQHFVEELELGQDYSLLKKLRLAPKSIYSFEARSKIRALVREVQPDICHLHNIYHHLSPAILSVLKQEGVPCVMTLHDLQLACPAYKMLTHDGVCERCKGGQYFNVVKNRCVNGSLALSALVYFETHLHKMLNSYTGNVDKFIVPSQFYADKLVEWGMDRAKISYIPNAIDVSRFSPTQSAGSGFVYVGRLVAEKGVHTLLQAAGQAGVPLTIVGEGPEKEALQELAKKSGTDVSFAGYLSGDQLHAAIRNARAVVLPSEWYENAPISVLEAFAFGVPVIGADIGGIPEMIEDGVTGAIFESGNVGALASVLKVYADLSNDSILELGRAARASLDGRFDQQTHLDSLRALYGSLVPSLPAG